MYFYGGVKYERRFKYITLIVFYEKRKEEINNIRIEKKSLSINVKINIDNYRKIFYLQNLSFIEIKYNDKIKENAFLSVDEIKKKKCLKLEIIVIWINCIILIEVIIFWANKKKNLLLYQIAVFDGFIIAIKIKNNFF